MVLVLQDFSKALDMVNHLLFFHKLGSDYDFHTSFLQNRSMMVEVDGVRSSPRSLFSGVPQDCLPCPLFFSMFINGLCTSNGRRPFVLLNFISMLIICRFIYLQIRRI
jgi:hypothetical protein